MIPKQTFFNGLLLFLASTTLLFGFFGWQAQAESLSLSFGDTIYRSITTLLLSDTFESSQSWNQDWRIDISRWLGVATFVLGASKALTLLLASRFETRKAIRRKGHIILVGDDPFATAIAKVATQHGREVNWLSTQDNLNVKKNEKLFVSDALWDISLAKQYGLASASAVVIATQDDASAIAIARQIRSEVPNEEMLKIFVTIRTPWIALSIDELEGVTGIRMFSRAQAAARLVHRKHPPFLVSKYNNQSRIHALIIGFDQHGEAILIDLLLSCLTSYLEKPFVTIIDDNADNLKQQLKLRYPELHKSVDLNFIQGSLEGDHANLAEETIIKLSNKLPITIGYVCLSEDTTTLSTALALRAIALRHQVISGPILTHLTISSSLPEVKVGVKHLKAGQLIGYGSLTEMVNETGILNDDADGLARVMHDAYCTVSDENNVSKIAWSVLPEDKRDSNRRIVSHMFAKLSSAGIDIESWLEEIDKKPNISNLPNIPDFAADKKVAKELAVLEHDRWMADRRINGWRYATKRDDARKLHSDLIPFSELSEQSKEYDRIMIETLRKMLTDKNFKK